MDREGRRTVLWLSQENWALDCNLQSQLSKDQPEKVEIVQRLTGTLHLLEPSAMQSLSASHLHPDNAHMHLPGILLPKGKAKELLRRSGASLRRVDVMGALQLVQRRPPLMAGLHVLSLKHFPTPQYLPVYRSACRSSFSPSAACLPHRSYSDSQVDV